jgi:hypothetical protein
VDCEHPSLHLSEHSEEQLLEQKKQKVVTPASPDTISIFSSSSIFICFPPLFYYLAMSCIPPTAQRTRHELTDREVHPFKQPAAHSLVHWLEQLELEHPEEQDEEQVEHETSEQPGEHAWVHE